MQEGIVSISTRGAQRLQNGHLWVYRSDVRHSGARSGDVVRLHDEHGRYMGRAFFSETSQISIRLLTRHDEPVNRDFFRNRILQALRFRERSVENTEVYRLVFGEADLLPSLIVDRYGDYLVMQTLSRGTDMRRELFVDILRELCTPKGIVERNDPRVRLLEGMEQRSAVAWGDVPEQVVYAMNGIRMAYDLLKGQKTGGFLDQRENRLAVARYATGEVLDCFCYMGGFSLTIAPHCDSIEAIDISPDAIQRALCNNELNGYSNINFQEGNSFDYLKHCDETGRKFDMVILDPPAFAKNRDSVPTARRGYKEINLRAMKLLRSGGYLVTCSCSHHISESMFLEILVDAALDTHKTIGIVERRTQAKDHPVLLTMPETNYLKCFITRLLD